MCWSLWDWCFSANCLRTSYKGYLKESPLDTLWDIKELTLPYERSQKSALPLHTVALCVSLTKQYHHVHHATHFCVVAPVTPSHNAKEVNSEIAHVVLVAADNIRKRCTHWDSSPCLLIFWEVSIIGGVNCDVFRTAQLQLEGRHTPMDFCDSSRPIAWPLCCLLFLQDLMSCRLQRRVACLNRDCC